jgi:pimeloyl-ACP methyl ester carboxylesterase
MYKYIALTIIIVLLYNIYLHMKKWNIKILGIVNILIHTSKNQRLISEDNDRVEDLFDKYSYKTFIYNTSYEHIAITENIEKGNKNKYVLWLNGVDDVFCHPFVSKEFIKKGYDIYSIDFPNNGFARINKKSFSNYPYTSQLLEYLHICIKEINKNYINPEIILYGFSFGALLGLSYISIYGNIFSKIILNSPAIDSIIKDNRDYILFLSLFYKDIDLGNINEISYQSLSLSINDLRPYGILKKDIDNVLRENVSLVNNKGYGRYLIIEDNKININLIQYMLERIVYNSVYDTPTLVLISDKYTKDVNNIFEISNTDLFLDLDDVKNKCNMLFKNYKLEVIDNSVHDIFYSNNLSRNIALSKVLDFI